MIIMVARNIGNKWKRIYNTSEKIKKGFMMINIGKKSKLKPEEIIAKSVSFFGPNGVGLKVVDEERCCARFEGGGGYISVRVSEVEGNEERDVNVQGREYDYHIKNFMKELR